ncbi:ParA family protein [Hymenobacter crusticola]|jgi:chromosome partitioning protein|uniref:Chromosome partitioning protein ParA n=1 Tax=Hymenobacter crusticola TaxID=1770526 RepID=A0A243W6I3_9BACT|nr:ParA family protein [Hymenobacter crusticola]OUJ67673.1 chromosome partitioning protein ParA [Hymenobacter crusticola]
MSKIIAFTNQKGGVGKTTSAANIGAGLARAGHRVLLVDLDPQVNLTHGLGLLDAEFNVYGALLHEYKVKAYPIQERLALIAGSPALSSFEKVKGDELDREFLLKDLLEPLHERCDYILLDCPPALGLITLNAYACATDLYIPLEAQLYATEGLEKVLEMVARVKRRLNPGLKVGGIFFTRFDPRKVLRRETAEVVRDKYPDLVLTSTIREAIALGEAPHLGQDIFSYAPTSAGAADYETLVKEILTR